MARVEPRVGWELADALLHVGALFGACEEYTDAELPHVTRYFAEKARKRGLCLRDATRMTRELQGALSDYKYCSFARPQEWRVKR